MTNSVCIEDFCGNMAHGGFCADWKPDQGIVVFGGTWRNVPTMPAKTLPSEDAVYAWVKRHRHDDLHTTIQYDGASDTLGRSHFWLLWTDPATGIEPAFKRGQYFFADPRLHGFPRPEDL